MQARVWLACLVLGALAWAAPLAAQPIDNPWPDLGAPVSSIGGGTNDVAVVVAVEEYAELPPVPGALQNAEDWFHYFETVRDLPSGQTLRLYSKRATREKMLKALRAQVKLAKKGGTFWVFFSGQGAPGNLRSGPLLSGYDTQAEPESVEERAVSLQEVLTELRAGKQSRVVLVIDAQTSGLSPDGKPIVRGLSASEPDLASFLAAHKKKSKQEAVVLLATKGTQGAQVLPGDGRPAFGYFTLGALRGWSDADENGTVSAQELRDYTAAAMVALVPGAQTPVLGTTKSELLLGESVELGPRLSDLFARLSGLSKPGPAPSKTTPSKPEPSKPGPTPSKSATSSIEAMEVIILDKVNELRSANGLKPLHREVHLLKAAREHSEEMAVLNYFSHESPTRGREEFVDRIKLAGGKDFGHAGENIAFRSANISDEEMALALYQQWEDSPPHLENMLDPDFGMIGIGLYREGNKVWATQVFADRVR